MVPVAWRGKATRRLTRKMEGLKIVAIVTCWCFPIFVHVHLFFGEKKTF